MKNNSEKPSLNLKSKGKPMKRTRKEEQVSLEMIDSLHQKLDEKIRESSQTSHRVTAEMNKKVLKSQKMINAFTHRKRASEFSSAPGTEDLLKMFAKLSELKVNSDLFKSSALMKVLKLFARESDSGKDKNVELLGDVAVTLVAHWEKVCLLEDNLNVSADPASDKDLRKNGNKKIAKVLADKGFAKKKTTEMAARCEENIWNQSKGFASSYKTALSKVVGQLAELHQAEIEATISKIKNRT